MQSDKSGSDYHATSSSDYGLVRRCRKAGCDYKFASEKRLVFEGHTIMQVTAPGYLTIDVNFGLKASSYIFSRCLWLTTSVRFVLLETMNSTT